MIETSTLAASVANLPSYLGFLGALLALIIVATVIYKQVTPYREMELIRQNNAAAAVSLGGFMIGFALALESIASGTGLVWDMLMWGAFALATQLVAFFAVRFLIPGLREGIEDGKMAYGILLGAVSITVGIANAGALSS